MGTKKLFYFLLLLCIVNSAIAQKIPTPKEHFGFNIGDNYQLATFTQTEAYFKKIAAASDRAKYTVIGKTEEGRDQFMMIVTSPENQKKLEQYKLISQKLGNADIGIEEAKQLSKEGKAVVWIDGGLHATETVGIHQLIETAYQLLSRNDDETMRILNDVIILITHANPDGQELVSNWYMRDTAKEKRSLSNLPRLYEKYAGHDNNRDFYMLNLKESQNIARQLFIEWIPQIMYNHHQAGPAGSVVAGAPYRDPFNFVFDPLIITGLDALGAAMQNRLNAENKPGYTSKSGSTFSTWYNGGLRTTTYFHNMIGLLTEIIGNPTPSDIPLVTARLIPNAATPNPVLPQKWLFKQSIDYSVSLNYAVLNYASRNRDELLYNIYLMGKNSIDKGNKDTWSLSPSKIEEMNRMYQDSLKRIKGNNESSRNQSTNVPVKFYDSVMKNKVYKDARGYIIPSDQPDFATAVDFLNALIKTGVVVQKATADFTIAGKKYPANSYIVKTNQAFRPHILDLFEPQDHPNDFQYPGGPPVPPYDAAGWTLAYQMGVQFDRVMEAFDGPFEKSPIGVLLKLNGSVVNSASTKGYVLDARANQSFKAVNILLNEGIEVYRITNVSNSSLYASGSFFISKNAKTKTAVEKISKENSAEFLAMSEKPSSLIKISKARIALWDIYGGSMASGWTRWILEQFNYAYDIVYPKDIDTGNLRSKYDVIVLVGGAIPSVNSRGGGGENNLSNIPVEYKNRTGRITADKSIPQLKIFLEQGGNIVTIGSSTQLAYHLKLPVTDAMVEIENGVEKPLSREKFYTPGSILRVTTDNSLLSASGMNTETDVYFDNNPVFKMNPDAVTKGIVKPIAWFANDKPLRSGWAWGQVYLKNGVAAFEATVGKGKLFAFGPEITFRAQAQGTFKLLFNQLYNQ
ncbi:MAG: M14 metallopeptidase family protein [Ferruginibacter sp.]